MTSRSDTAHWTEDPEILSEYVLGRLSPAAREPLNGHLSRCLQCREAVRRESVLAAGAKRAGRDMLKERLSVHLRARDAIWYQRNQFVSLAAAVLIVLLGLGIFRFYVGSLTWPSKFSSTKYVVTHSATDTLRDEKVEGAGRGSGIDERTAISSPQAEVGLGHEGSFWLLGKVIVVEEGGSEIGRDEGELAAQSSGFTHDDSAGAIERVIAIQHEGAEQIITLRQVSTAFLPRTLAVQLPKLPSDALETLVEKSSAGLNLTFYRNTLVQRSEFRKAAVEAVGRDSLIVELGKERIAYRIPGGWSSETSAPPTPDRQ